LNSNKAIIVILFFALIVRVYNITSPLIGWHSWRQTDTAAIARNFYESNNSILYPQIDWRGNSEGFVETEFQVYPYFISMLYKIFGVHDYIGRIVSVLFALLSIYGLYLLVKEILTERIAIWSSFIYAILPLNIYFTRAFMPESAMLMCSIYGVYFFYKWIDSDSIKYYIFSLVSISLACLLKLPTLYIGLPLAFLAIKKFGLKRAIKNYKIWLFVVFVLSIVFLWYYHAHNLYKQTGLTFSIWDFGKDKWGMVDILFKISFYNDIFMKSIAERHLTYAGFVLCIWGIFKKRKFPYEKVFDFYLIAIIIFIFIAPQAHLAQEYYQLPISIPASVFMAKILSEFLNLKKWKQFSLKYKIANIFTLFCLISIPILSYLRIANFYKSENPEAGIIKMGNEISNISQKNDLIISVTDGNPNELYFAERKGWIISNNDININVLNNLKNKGAKFLIGEKKYLKSEKEKLLDSEMHIVSSDIEYFIYKF
jgi:4-amino-4-deoxy-L-arabinose transferase-like glycosyltransferase